jgi:hypothetical protein
MNSMTSPDPDRRVSNDLVPLSSSTIYVARPAWEDDVIEADAFEISIRPCGDVAEVEPLPPNYVPTPPSWRGTPRDYDPWRFRYDSQRDRFGRTRRPKVQYRWYQRRPRTIVSVTVDRQGWHLFISHKARRVIGIVIIVLTFVIIGRLSEAIQFILGALF